MLSVRAVASPTFFVFTPPRRGSISPMEPTACPPFEEAICRFQEFLSENGWPSEIVWVRTEEDLEPLPTPAVTREFERARQRGLGVCLYAIRKTGSSSLAVVENPRDSDEAERFMYPLDGGLKLSVAVRRSELSQVPLGESNT